MADERKPDWDRIVDLHGERVFRIALRILGSVQEAEDVAQDVFVEAYQLHSAGPIRTYGATWSSTSTFPTNCSMVKRST